MKQTLLMTAAVLIAAPALAQGDLGAHVHGHAQIDMALNPDGQLIAEFSSPKANLVGFEYAARTAEEREVEEQAEALLLDGAALFRFSEAAACVLVSAEMGEDHGHEENHNAESHSDMDVSYVFQCDNPDRLSSIAVGLFEHFGGFEEIELVYLDEDNQIAQDLTPDNAGVSW